MGRRQHTLIIGADVEADDNGVNRLVSEGESSVLVTGEPESENRNEIITGKSDDLIVIAGMFKAECHINHILTGEGDGGHLIIGNDIKASKGGVNSTETGSGNDYN